MRLQGRVTEWNDKRGFGFVTQNGSVARAFLHVSAFGDSRRRPVVGSLITFELRNDAKGRPQAGDAQFVSVSKPNASSFAGIFGSAVVSLVILIVVVYVGYIRFSNPNSTFSASIYKIVSAREALKPHPDFHCELEKDSCSKMTSCAEALFHLERCRIQDMDGDQDGIPCEQQWCN